MLFSGAKVIANNECTGRFKTLKTEISRNNHTKRTRKVASSNDKILPICQQSLINQICHTGCVRKNYTIFNL